ncbi:MAG: hypothetical protein COV69_03555 [Parcubacteria group bacterium CG11_big_fil_rev_8_21_14_0_20_39_14]|nr:MAG: hypothetical protein COV69_03555 [Parcubacteria group bacterium CG11_big_fil_rev_8_21_14_0_20_39_14]PIS35400.1 MAG: hypothetical protein COT36_02565 [Parcubacteria group bacterium CG08_land_8_20_14_0_20_38_56]
MFFPDRLKNLEGLYFCPCFWRRQSYAYIIISQRGLSTPLEVCDNLQVKLLMFNFCYLKSRWKRFQPFPAIE